MKKMAPLQSAAAVAVVLSVLPVSAGNVRGPENLALHKSYTFSAVPNYGPCTDPGDNTQLTDGHYSDNDSFRVDKRTVGWRGAGAVSVTIDLEHVQPIGRLTFRGNADGGVGFPVFIHIWVKDAAADNFTYGGELLSGAWRNGLPYDMRDSRGKPTGTHLLDADNLTLRGRYVKFTIYKGGGYVWTDELAVFRGDCDPGDVVPGDIELPSESDFEQWAQDHRHDPIARIRMLLDLEELARHPQAGRFSDDMNRLRQEVLGMPMLEKLDMPKGLPYTDLHARIWAVNGRLQQAGGGKAFSVWPTTRYRPLHPYDAPDGKVKVAGVDLIGGEYRSAAVNVSNFTRLSRAAEVRLQWETRGWPEDSVKLRLVRFTETQERVIASLAVPEAEQIGKDLWHVDLRAGVTSQLWLTFHARDVKGGNYRAIVSVQTADGKHADQVPVNVNVHAGCMPREPSLHSGMWDYLSIPPYNSYLSVTKDNRGPAAALLREYLVSSRWLAPQAMPGAVSAGSPGSSRDRNKDGTLKRPMSFEGFDDWLAAIGPVSYHMLYLKAEHPRKSHYLSVYDGGFAPGTPEYRTAVSSYIAELAKHINAKGLDTERFVLCVMDEPSGHKKDSLTAEFIDIARKAEPKFLFFEDPAIDKTSHLNEDLQRVLDTSDIVCPYVRCLDPGSELREYYLALQAEGKILGGYSCGDGGWLRSANGYFRKMAWQAWHSGLKYIGVWAYMSTNYQPAFWDDFRAGPTFDMIFFTADSVTPSKLLEAWREGIEDYEYFCILESLILQCEKDNRRPDVLASAKKLVKNLAGTVITDAREPAVWQRSAGSATTDDIFDQARLQLLEAIDQLSDQ